MDKYIITMLGEKDHGKSTLIGNLLIGTGTATEARINEVKKSVKSARFEPAHILDSFAEERVQEMTIDTTRAELVYKKAILELIDVPGHLELIKNMMSGASNSDLAVLMVSVKKEEGFQPQTKRHIFLASMFGIKALIVAINKMDFADYDKSIFERTKREISEYLDSIGFDKPKIFVPISAYNNENLISISKNMPWYKGEPLLDIVRDFAGRHSKKSGISGTRMLVQDSMDIEGERTIFGILYNGSMAVNDTVRIEPNGASATVHNLFVKGKKVRTAKEGANVAVTFKKDVEIERGSVVYGKSEKPYRKGAFDAKIFVINGIDASPGGGLSLKMNNNLMPLKGIKVSKVLSPISGKYSEPSKKIAANNVVYANLSLKVQYPVERYEDYSELGRFAIYRNDDFVGVGVVE